MAVEALSVDDVPITTADLDLSEKQAEDATSEIGPAVDVMPDEGNVAPDDMLRGSEDSTPQEEAPADDELVVDRDEVAVKAEKAKEQELGQRASKRVQEAVNRAKAAEVQVAQMQQQYQQQLAYMQHQMQQQMAAQQAALQKQQEFYSEQAKRAAAQAAYEDESKLTPAQRVEKAWLDKARQAMTPEIQRLQSELATERAHREKVYKAAQDRQQLQVYKGRADNVSRNMLFKDFESASVDKLLPRSQELLLTWGTAAGEEPEQAAQGFKQFLEDYYNARLRSVAKKSGFKSPQIKSAPAPVAQRKSAPAPSGKTFKFDTQSGKWGHF